MVGNYKLYWFFGVVVVSVCAKMTLSIAIKQVKNKVIVEKMPNNDKFLFSILTNK